VTPEDRLLLLLGRGTFTEDLHERALALVGGASWSQLLERSEAHGVAPLVGRNLDRLGWPGVPRHIREAFEAARRLNAARSLIAVRALRQLLDGLGRARIPVIPLKGTSLAESLYGDPALRVSSDIDVLVPRDAAASAFAVLASLGYAPETGEPAVAADDMELLLEGNIEYAFGHPAGSAGPVELHWDIAWRWPGGPAAVADLWADARPRRAHGSPSLALGPEWELLYLAVHAARHRWAALKWLVDVHEVCVRGALDWDSLRDKAARFRLGNVLGITLGACRALFGTSKLPAHAVRMPPSWLRLFPAAPGPSDIWRGALYPTRLFPRLSDKLTYLGRVLLAPTLAERRSIRLPARLAVLYYPLRPIRLAGRWGLETTGAGLRQFRADGRSDRTRRRGARKPSNSLTG